MSRKLLDRFARGELSPAESRDLARQALGDHDLFEELTATAIARAGLAAGGRERIRWPRIAIFAAAAAAVIVAVVLRAPQWNPKPVIAISPVPALLARGGDSEPSAFRGTDMGSREPRATGSIGSITGDFVTIDLGTLDGLAKDTDLDVIRGDHAIGHIALTSVFRDHARGRIAGGASIGVHDRVRVPPSARLRAILDQIDAALARGESNKAMNIAQQASLETFDAGLSREEDLNNAGVIAALHGDPAKADELYRRALHANPSGHDREAIEKNLATLKGAR